MVNLKVNLGLIGLALFPEVTTHHVGDRQAVQLRHPQTVHLLLKFFHLLAFTKYSNLLSIRHIPDGSTDIHITSGQSENIHVWLVPGTGAGWILFFNLKHESG